MTGCTGMSASSASRSSGDPGLRFASTPHEHKTFMIVDPSGNVVEFKCYVLPENSY